MSKKRYIEHKYLLFLLWLAGMWCKPYATRIENFRIGSFVKVLVKKYSDSMYVYPGVVVGFEPFKALPTIIILYIEKDYSKSKLHFLSYNEQEEKHEVVLADPSNLSFDYDSALSLFDNEIIEKGVELQQLKNKKEVFVKEFQHYIENIKEVK